MTTQSNPALSYFVPGNSRWPALCSIAVFLVACGFISLFNGIAGAPIIFIVGKIFLFYVMYGWWKDVAVESEGGSYKQWEDVSFRWGMGWFIFSEVMFFAAFFGSLFYARVIAVPDLASENSKLLWPTFEAIWPTAGPHAIEEFSTISPWTAPLYNTIILLTSSVTVTWAHHAIIADNRKQVNIGLALTILLGVIFLILQAEEYVHAYRDLNLRLDSGIYGSTFFMLTGFHGLHVTIGTICLIVIFARCLLGHFSPKHHFGFEAVAWYWHFVDVVWLLLFVIVYIL